MKKTTALITWPVQVDYPLFRYRLCQYSNLFEKIIICFTNLNQITNYQNFLIHKLPFCFFMKPFGNKEDWRDDTVNSMLSVETDAERYLFMEQDFLIKDITILKHILNHDEPFIYYEEGGRIHPAFALVDKALVNQTSKDFAAHPPEGDHFIHFFKEILKITPGYNLTELGFEEKKDFYHMSGLSQNYACFDNNQPFYKPKEFIVYNSLSMLLPYQEMSFEKKQQDIAEKFGFTEEETFLTHFFPTFK